MNTLAKIAAAVGLMLGPAATADAALFNNLGPLITGAPACPKPHL